MFKKFHLLFISVALLLMFLPASAQGNRVILNNNAGSGNSIWQIQGEPTLVMNGFDLVPTPLRMPVVIENINIEIFTPQPAELVDVVVYQDPNGGSPSDAVLVASTQVVLADRGVNVVEFPSPVVVDAPVVWIGFYMPVNMEFLADRQGSSVLTYWAWTPGARFDLRDLSSAQVLGPSDGSGPVNIDLDGIARIRAEAITANTTITETFLTDDVDFGVADRLDLLINYSGCPTLFKDESDIIVSYDNEISANCSEQESWNAPRSPSGFTRRTNSRGIVYDLSFFTDDGEIIAVDLPIPVTHCVTPAINEIDVAVIGLAYGSPRRWEFLPSEKFGNLLCAEIPRGGSLSYFTPD